MIKYESAISQIKKTKTPTFWYKLLVVFYPMALTRALPSTSSGEWFSAIACNLIDPASPCVPSTDPAFLEAAGCHHVQRKPFPLWRHGGLWRSWSPSTDVIPRPWKEVIFMIFEILEHAEAPAARRKSGGRFRAGEMNDT